MPSMLRVALFLLCLTRCSSVLFARESPVTITVHDAKEQKELAESVPDEAGDKAAETGEGAVSVKNSHVGMSEEAQTSRIKLTSRIRPFGRGLVDSRAARMEQKVSPRIDAILGLDDDFQRRAARETEEGADSDEKHTSRESKTSNSRAEESSSHKGDSEHGRAFHSKEARETVEEAESEKRNTISKGKESHSSNSRTAKDPILDLDNEFRSEAARKTGEEADSEKKEKHALHAKAEDAYEGSDEDLVEDSQASRGKNEETHEDSESKAKNERIARKLDAWRAHGKEASDLKDDSSRSTDGDSHTHDEAEDAHQSARGKEASDSKEQAFRHWRELQSRRSRSSDKDSHKDDKETSDSTGESSRTSHSTDKDSQRDNMETSDNKGDSSHTSHSTDEDSHKDDKDKNAHQAKKSSSGGLELKECKCKDGGCDASSPLSKWPTIHLIYGLWDKGPVPSAVRERMSQWEDLNPGWEVKLWDRRKVDAFVKEHFHGWVQAFSGAAPIFQSDIFRYMVVLKEGGLYVDSDVRAVELKSTLGCSSSSNGVTDVFMQETMGVSGNLKELPIREGHAEYVHRIANYAFFAGPGSEILARTLRLVRRRLDQHLESSQSSPYNQYTPIFVTGPDALSEAVQGVRFQSFLEDHPEDASELPVRVCTDQGLRNLNAHGWVKNRKALIPASNFIEKRKESWWCESV